MSNRVKAIFALSRILCLWGAVGLLIGGGNGSAASIELSDYSRDFVVQNWTVDDGLPQNSVLGITQTPDGYLWFATYNGLVRFDGVKFTVFDTSNTPEMGSSAVYAMHLAKDGRLCLIMEGGDFLVMQDGRFTRQNGYKGLPNGPLSIVAESPEGYLDVVEESPGGSLYSETASGAFVKTDLAAIPAQDRTDEIEADTRGWVWYKQGGKWWRSLGPQMAPFITGGLRLASRSRSGGTWVVFKDGIYLRGTRDWLRRLEGAELIGGCTAGAEDFRGDLWISTWSQGLVRYDVEGHLHAYQLDRAARPEPVRHVFVDREGNIWAGTETSGVFRLRPRLFKNYGAAEGMQGTDLAKGVVMDSRQTLWVITPGNLQSLNTLDSPPSFHLQFEHELGWCLGQDRQGNVWMGDYGGSVFKWNSEVASRRWKVHLAHTAILSVFYDDGEGGILVGGAKGLWALKGTNFNHLDLPSDPAGSEVRAILRDQDARLWVGMNGGGLFFRNGTAWKSPPDQAGPPLRRVLAMRSGANGDLWIGSAGNGLYRWRKDTLFHFDSDVNGLPHTIGSLVEDRSGSLWMGSTEGIYRVRLSDLSALAAGQQAAIVSSRFTKADGMGSTECSVGTGPGIAEGPDGRLWFATRKGITAVDPQALPEASSPPPVFVEEALLWGDHDHDAGHARPLVAKPGGPKPLRAGADTRLVEIHYTAPGFTAPERVRFRYRLDGGDFGWSDAGTRRVAYFQGLAPGSYRFHVTARSHDSEWNPLEGVFEFTIDPHFWQTWWFNLLVTVAVGLLLLLIYRLRVAKIEAVNRLRVRLAGDLHDEIGANLGSIGLNAELMRQDVELSARQQEELGSLQRLAVQTAQSLRDLVWFTNPDFDNTGDMLLRMRDVAALLLAGRTWKFEGEAVMPNRVLDPEFRRNVFFVFKEALHNIAKHSGAQGVQIEFHELGEGIEIKIEDNGRGLPPTVANPGNGLKSMRRRAGALGGTLDIRSENGKGVSLLLKVPYRKSPVGWFSRTPENSGDEKIR